MDLDLLKRGQAMGAPTVSGSMATAVLAYSGIAVKMLVDQRLDAQLHTMFMVDYEPRACANPHDHPFEESYYMLEGEVDVVANGDRHTLRPGDAFWTGTGCVHAFYETQGGRVRWLETSAPGPATASLVPARARLGLPGRAPGLRRERRSQMSRVGETAATAARRGLDRFTEMYRRMLLIRGFEDRVQSLFLRGEVYGTTHLYSGQEAVAVGFASALGPADRVACTYRGHGHLLAMGTDPEGLLAELLGRETGVNGGRAGSMNVVDPEHGVLGCYGIVGGSIAAATGAGLSLRGTGAVAVAYFGDGTTNQAYFFECLNFAKVFELPVVYVCENNGYGEYTPFEAVTPGGIVPRAAAMQLPDDGARRDGRPRRSRRGGGDRRACPRRRRSRVRRGADVSLRRSLAQRPGQVPARGRARALARARPARRRGGAPAGRARHGRRTRSHRSPASVEAELDRIEAAALAAPFPSEISLPEFHDGR